MPWKVPIAAVNFLILDSLLHICLGRLFMLKLLCFGVATIFFYVVFCNYLF